LIPNLTQKHELSLIKSQNLLVTNHMNQSKHLANQEWVLDCVMDFINFNMLNKKSFYVALQQ
jgi:hypothetical protein